MSYDASVLTEPRPTFWFPDCRS